MSLDNTKQDYLLQAIDLKKHYPVKKGLFGRAHGEGAGRRLL